MEQNGPSLLRRFVLLNDFKLAGNTFYGFSWDGMVRSDIPLQLDWRTVPTLELRWVDFMVERF